MGHLRSAEHWEQRGTAHVALKHRPRSDRHCVRGSDYCGGILGGHQPRAGAVVRSAAVLLGDDSPKRPVGACIIMPYGP